MDFLILEWIGLWSGDVNVDGGYESEKDNKDIGN